jgi:chemotaxis signal transduction protein
MNAESGTLAKRLQDLREAFDSSFSIPLEAFAEGKDSMALCCRVAKINCALPVHELSGFFKGHTIYRIPARSHGLLGVGRFRAEIIPVYDLGTWIGAPRSCEAGGWTVLVGRTQVTGFNVDSIEGYVTSHQPRLVLSGGSKQMKYLQGAVQHKGNSYALVRLKTLHRDIVHGQDSIKEAGSQG